MNEMLHRHGEGHNRNHSGLSGARVLRTINPGRGTMREMFGEGRGGGGQREDEKV